MIRQRACQGGDGLGEWRYQPQPVGTDAELAEQVDDRRVDRDDAVEPLEHEAAQRAGSGCQPRRGRRVAAGMKREDGPTAGQQTTEQAQPQKPTRHATADV